MESEKNTKKLIHYPDMNRLPQTVNQLLNHDKMKLVKLSDEVTDLIENNLIAFEILAPFFKERVERKRATQRRCNEKKKSEKRAEDTRKFFESLNEEQTVKFLEMRTEYNRLFDLGDFDEAERLRRLFSSWLYNNKDPETRALRNSMQTKRYADNKVEICKKLRDKTQAVRDSPVVQCNLCSLILENNSVQKRKHTQYHKKLVADGQVRWRLPA